MTLKGLFTVAEGENEQELFAVGETNPEAIGVPEEGEPLNPAEKPMAAPPTMPAPAPSAPQNPEQNNQDKSTNWKETKDVKQFTQFLKDDMQRIGNPMHWKTKSDKERGLGQLKKLDNFVSEALRHDYDGVLNISEIDQMRQVIERNIDQVERALEGLQMMQKQRKKMRRHGDEDADLTKEATAPHFNGMSIVITPFERAIVGMLLNGRASGGRDIEELYAEAKKEYDINSREELSIFQILADMGLPVFKDRLRFGKDQDPTREDGLGEWQSQYYA